ncbi:MAG: LacI family transcriptional regulator [Proteobacteria bacterium]|nr:LacI family transcriptional regulator [Pseudomonadota bacterium]
MITIKDIAKRAGVSIGTVDSVLHGRERMAARTEKRIRDIVDESGYKPNLIARSLSLKRNL